MTFEFEPLSLSLSLSLPELRFLSLSSVNGDGEGGGRERRGTALAFLSRIVSLPSFPNFIEFQALEDETLSLLFLS
jgi:hypothetical protein